MRLIPAAALILALAAEQPPRSSDQPIKSSVDLVRVDVSAVDAKGRPIPDLGREDFELHVDGRPRAIASVQFVHVPADAATGPIDPGHYSSNAGAAGGRLIMILIDRTSIAAGRAKSSLLAAGKFVGSLHRADRVALATIPEGPQINFTADHALVQRLILELDGTAVDSVGTRNIGIADALAFERKDDFAIQMITERECGVPAVGGNQRSGSSEAMICHGEVKAEALLVAADARERTRQSIAGLQALLERFPPSQTPKVLVFLSQGLVIAGEPSPLSWLEARAAAAHVTIYPLLVEPSGMDASRRRPQTTPIADRAVQEQGLAALAQATGGDLFRIISNSDFAFDRLAAELSGYYLLGFEPEAAERDGMPHAIRVRVGRRGVTVRSRRQFTIPLNTVTSPDAGIVAALRDPLPAVDIPLRLTTYAFRDPRQDQMRLLIAAEIDRPAVGGQIAVGYVVVDFNGRLVASRLDSELPAPAPDQPILQTYFSTVPVDSGKYTVKLAAVDDAGRRGSVERVAIVRTFGAGPVSATELVLGHRSDRGWALPLAPTVTGEVTGGSLEGSIELFADDANAFEHVSVTLEIAESETSAALARVPMQLVTAKNNVRRRVAWARMNLARFPPGNYVARAVIAVRLDVVGQVSRPFRIATE